MITQHQYSLVARSYATALFHTAQKQGILQRVREECRVLGEVARGKQKGLTIFMESPQISTEDKMAVFDRVLKPRVSTILIKMIHLLVTRERRGVFADITELFELMVEEAEGIDHATVETARELRMQDKLRLKDALEKYTHRRLKIEFVVDSRLIGGLIFRYGDVLIDSSLRHGLDEIQDRLCKTQVIRVGA